MRCLKSSEARIEALAREMVLAINTQTLDPRSPPWDSTTPDFTAEVAWTTTPQKVNLVEYLTALRKVTNATPQGRLHIVDISAGVQRGTGSVFVNQEWHNAPPGLVRPSIALYDFLYTGREWKCTRYRCLPGINPRAGMAAMVTSS